MIFICPIWYLIAIVIPATIITIILFSLPNKENLCDGCNKPMNEWHLQAYTNQGDKFYCKECSDIILKKG